MKSPVPLSNSNLLKLSSDLLERGASIRFQAKGFSMRPFIQDGDLITVSPLGNYPIRAGDVVLYRTVNDRVIVHRVILKTRVEGRVVFFVKGDANLSRAEETDITS